jgi:hypothetical protein
MDDVAVTLSLITYGQINKASILSAFHPEAFPAFPVLAYVTLF